jgi:hypothetical protein
VRTRGMLSLEGGRRQASEGIRGSSYPKRRDPGQPVGASYYSYTHTTKYIRSTASIGCLTVLDYCICRVPQNHPQLKADFYRKIGGLRLFQRLQLVAISSDRDLLRVMSISA